MDTEMVLVVLLRWLHILSAALVLGGAFFAFMILPRALGHLSEEHRAEAIARARRMFKMVVHTAILLLLVSGIYNSIRLFGEYRVNPPLLHGLWGMHILVGLAVFAISIWQLTGRDPKPKHRMWMGVNVLLLIVLLGLGASLKWARETQVRLQQEREAALAPVPDAATRPGNDQAPPPPPPVLPPPGGDGDGEGPVDPAGPAGPAGADGPGAAG